VVAIGKFKLHYAWVVLFAACMLNIASRADHGSFGRGAAYRELFRSDLLN